MTQIQTINETNIDTILSSDKKTILLDFTAKWCGPCKMMNPILEEIAKENELTLSIYKIDVDESPELAQRYGVQGMPTFVLLNKGNEIKRRAGAAPKSSFVAWLASGSASAQV